MGFAVDDVDRVASAGLVDLPGDIRSELRTFFWITQDTAKRRERKDRVR
jgi:hypothetical protein